MVVELMLDNRALKDVLSKNVRRRWDFGPRPVRLDYPVSLVNSSIRDHTGSNAHD